jgi:toxin ParE1/3/4
MSAKTYNIILKPSAKRDIYKIWYEMSQQGMAAADRFVDRIDRRVLSLAEFPDRGAPRYELSKGLRMLVEGKYLVFYRLIGSRVEILRVVHGARDLSRLFP